METILALASYKAAPSGLNTVMRHAVLDGKAFYVSNLRIYDDLHYPINVRLQSSTAQTVLRIVLPKMRLNWNGRATQAPSITESEWEKHRPVICQLRPLMSLDCLKDIMERDHNFIAS